MQQITTKLKVGANGTEWKSKLKTVKGIHSVIQVFPDHKDELGLLYVVESLDAETDAVVTALRADLLVDYANVAAVRTVM